MKMWKMLSCSIIGAKYSSIYWSDVEQTFFFFHWWIWAPLVSVLHHFITTRSFSAANCCCQVKTWSLQNVNLRGDENWFYNSVFKMLLFEIMGCGLCIILNISSNKKKEGHQKFSHDSSNIKSTQTKCYLSVLILMLTRHQTWTSIESKVKLLLNEILNLNKSNENHVNINK